MEVIPVGLTMMKILQDGKSPSDHLDEAQSLALEDVVPLR